MGITYNGTTDDGAAGGHPLNSYGTDIPMVGITMIVLPGDTGTTFSPAGSFTYFNNDASIIGNPIVDTQFNNYLRSKILNGEHFSNDYTGPGIPSHGYGSGPDCNYVFTGDPSIPAQWSECQSENTPGDRRFIITSNNFTLTPGSSQHIVMALVTTNPDTSNGCGDPGLTFDSIKTVADTAWSDYFTQPATIPSSVNSIAQLNAVNIYPNPAHDKLYIESNSNTIGEVAITIYNSIGQQMVVDVTRFITREEIDVSHLPEGVYYVKYRNGNVQKKVKFVKVE